MNLTEFLLARIAEDERVARDAGDSGPVVHGRRSELSRAWDRDYGPEVGTVEIDSARVLADCQAKRQIVEWCAPFAGGNWGDMELGELYELADTTLANLASIYADHPEYRQEWKP